MYSFITDLDNTLIYSGQKLGGDRVCVETKEGRELSFMKRSSYDRFLKLREAQATEVIPATTRSLEQYQRITMFQEEIPKLALVSNGGILLRDGEIDRAWLEETEYLIEESITEMEKAKIMLRGIEEINFEIRNIDNLFLFTKSADTLKTIGTLSEALDSNLLKVCTGLNKIYVMPRVLDKGLSLKRLRSHGIVKNPIIAAGDSDFDVPMLIEADIAIGLEEQIDCYRRSEGFETGGKLKESFWWTGEPAGFADYVLETVEKIVRC